MGAHKIFPGGKGCHEGYCVLRECSGEGVPLSKNFLASAVKIVHFGTF